MDLLQEMILHALAGSRAEISFPDMKCCLDDIIKDNCFILINRIKEIITIHLMTPIALQRLKLLLRNLRKTASTAVQDMISDKITLGIAERYFNIIGKNLTASFFP